jgi:serine/threonine-protein kinase
MAVICQGCGSEHPTWAGKCPNCGATRSLSVGTKKDSLIDKVIAGRFEIKRRLGAGGMGAVYYAEQVGIGQPCAVKFLNASLSEDAEIVRRFLNEAKTYVKVQHPNAVHLYDFGQTEDGQLYISMEYVEGKNLKQYLETHERLKVADAVDIAMQVCDVLAHAHSKNIVHRDLKPENIMCAQSMRGYHVKVLDFGISKLVGQESTSLTATGAVCGTPRYMSPEQAQGLDIDQRSDIYALGLILFEMLTGTHPFTRSTVAEILRAQIDDPVPRLHEMGLKIGAPDAIDLVIQKATSKAAANRYATMTELAGALSRALPTPLGMTSAVRIEAAREPEPRPTDASGNMTVAAKKKSVATAGGTPPPASVGSGKKPIVLGAVGVLVAFGGGVGFMKLLAPAREQPDPPPVASVPAPATVKAVPAPALPAPPVESGARNPGASDPAADLPAPDAPAKPDHGGAEPQAKTVKVAERPKPLAPVPRRTPVAVTHKKEAAPVVALVPPPPPPAVVAPQDTGPGSLRVSTVEGGAPTWASVSVDGKPTSKVTPTTLSLAPGKHRVTIERTGYKTIDREVVIASGKTEVLRLELVP